MGDDDHGDSSSSSSSGGGLRSRLENFDTYPVEDTEPKYGDLPNEMTYGRRVARHLSAHHSWYFPGGRTRKEYEDSHPDGTEGDGTKEEGDEKVQEDQQEEEGVEVIEKKRSADDAVGGEEGGFVEEVAAAHQAALQEADKKKPPSLDAAWAYFEHVILPRHFTHDHGHGHGHGREGDDGDEADAEGGGQRMHKSRASVLEEHTSLYARTLGRLSRKKKHQGIDLLERAEPGESAERTSLYSVLNTPESQLADFGVGVGLYFSSLRVLGFVVLVAGLFNIPVIRYFGSAAYASDGQASISKGVLAGSAICTDTSWEACPTCTREQWDKFPATYDRYATSTDSEGNELRFILNNRCAVDATVGLWSFVALLWTFLAVHVSGKYAARREISYDEAQQTAADYSLEVENPPKDAYDVEEWRAFMQQFGGHVTVCTLALDNEDLVRLLSKRRRLLLKFEMGLPPGEELNTDDLEGQLEGMPPKPLWKKLFCLGHYEDTLRSIRELDAKIEEMSNNNYAVSNVFISFETEEAQRTALSRLSVRKLDVWQHNTGALPAEHLFRGEHVLSVREPPEPSAVRWHDLDETFLHQIITRVITTIISLGIIVGGGVCIALARRVSAATAAFVITVLNVLTPQFVHHITNLESHSSEGSKQTSQYVKMTALRWCNTAIVTTIINPFTDTAQDGNGHLINSLHAIFITELVKTPLLQIGDIMGNLNRHYFGPRAPDQRRMNLKFGGGGWRLSERYTDLTKVLFLCFFYASVYPAGFFWTSLTLFVHYWTDKFCLLRSWAPAPRLGTEISRFSRNYFFTITLFVYAFFLAYGYSGFPYDNACDDETPVSQNYVGTYNVTTSDSKDPNKQIEVTITITPDDTNYFYCWQDLLRYDDHAFPPLPTHQPPGAEWMTVPGQETWTTVLGWTCVAVLCLVGLIFFKRIIVDALRKVFFKPYKPSGKAMEEKFSEVEEIYGYVPQVKIAGYPFPKLLCYVDDIDRGLVGWTDPYHPYDRHNLILDVPKVAQAVKERRADKSGSAGDVFLTDSHLFSVVKNWPPEEAAS